MQQRNIVQLSEKWPIDVLRKKKPTSCWKHHGMLESRWNTPSDTPKKLPLHHGKIISETPGRESKWPFLWIVLLDASSLGHWKALRYWRNKPEIQRFCNPEMFSFKTWHLFFIFIQPWAFPNISLQLSHLGAIPYLRTIQNHHSKPHKQCQQVGSTNYHQGRALLLNLKCKIWRHTIHKCEVTSSGGYPTHAWIKYL